MGDLSEVVAYGKRIARDDSHGYSQPNRANPSSPDMDCSRLVQNALQAGGFPVGDGLFYTGNMGERLGRIGFSYHPGTSGLRFGDILWKPGHTAIYNGDGTVSEAAMDEVGDIVGRIPGDQTGQEIRIKRWDYTSWSGFYRAPQSAKPQPVPAPPPVQQIAVTKEHKQMKFLRNGRWIGIVFPDLVTIGFKNPTQLVVARRIIAAKEGDMVDVSADEYSEWQEFNRRLVAARGKGAL